MSQPLLELNDFCVSYGAAQAVHRVALVVNEGEIVTVIGPNGAGKTTLLCAAMGLLPSSGQLSLAGQRIARPSVEAMVAGGVALVPERRELFGEMSVEDNLLLGGFSRWRKGLRDQRERMQEVFAIFPRLQERRAQMASRPDALLWASGNLVDDVLEAEVRINFLQQSRVADTLLQDLIFGTKDVPVILRKTAHTHDSVQATRRLVTMTLPEFTVPQR